MTIDPIPSKTTMALAFRFDTPGIASQIRHRVANKQTTDDDVPDVPDVPDVAVGAGGADDRADSPLAPVVPFFGWRSRAFRDQVYIVFLEHAPIPKAVLPKGIFERMGVRFLDWLVVHAQPPPVFSHVEIMCFGGKLDPSPDVHFSTYMDAHAGWQRAGNFYLDSRERSWRALPVYDQHGLERAVREACTRICGAPYSVRKYPVAWSGLHWVSRFLDDQPQAEGQCADVTARILQLACADGSILPRRASTYGPSELYLALAHHLLRSSAPEDALEDQGHEGSDSSSMASGATGSDDQSLLDRRRFNPDGAARRRRMLNAPKCELDLLYASDERLKAISHDAAESQIEQLTDATLGALHGPAMEESVRCERELATALFRWSNELQRRYNHLEEHSGTGDVIAS